MSAGCNICKTLLILMLVVRSQFHIKFVQFRPIFFCLVWKHFGLEFSYDDKCFSIGHMRKRGYKRGVHLIHIHLHLTFVSSFYSNKYVADSWTESVTTTQLWRNPFSMCIWQSDYNNSKYIWKLLKPSNILYHQLFNIVLFTQVLV